MATETEVQSLAKPVRYISRYLQLRIVRKPGYSKEVDGQRVSTPGTSIQFDQGVFETTDPAEVAFIEGRSEFGKLIQRVPDNIEDIAGERTEVFQDLEAREKALADREAAIAAKEAALKNGELGKLEDEEDGDEEDDGLEALTKKQLLEVAATEEVEGVNNNTKNEDIVAAIRKKRDDAAAFTD